MITKILSKRQVIINGGVFALFILLGMGIYLNSLHNGFHYDDSHHVTGNYYIKNLENIPLFFKEPRTFSVFSGAFLHYRPLVLVSHALNYYFGELNPVGYHLVNLGFHIGSAYLVFLIIRRMMGEGISFFHPVAAGLLFLTTPFNSEVVNYISARSTVMCAFFCLLSFYCWVRFRGEETSHVSRLTSYLISLFAFVLAMLTKEMAITLPVMLLSYDLYFRKVSIKTIYRYIPFVTIGVFVGFISRLIFFGTFDPIKGKKAEGFYFIIKSKVLVKYFYDIILPYRLSIQHLIQDSLNFYFFLSIIVIMGLIILAFLLWRSSDHLWKMASFFILWYFVLLLPLIAVSLVAPYQENRGYLAGVAPLGILAIILEKFRMRWCRGGGLQKVFPYVLAGALVVLYSGGTIARNAVWKDDFILWSDVVNKYPLSTVGHLELGNYYHKIGNIYSAEMEYKTILKIDPEEFMALTNLGSLYYERGDSDRAMEFMQRALEIETNHMEANYYMAKIHKERGDLLSSSKHLLRMQLFSPHNVRVFEQLVENYANMGKLDYAYRMMSKALEKEPHNPGARRALGLIYMYNMQWDNAKKEFENVLSYIPNDYNTRIDLARAYEMQGRKDLARKELQKVLIATSKGDLNKNIYQSAQKRLAALK